MLDLQEHVRRFFFGIARGEIEIYNEFSLQHEFGVYLRTTLEAKLKIQFERPVSFFGLDRGDFEKKEIDIAIFAPDLSEKYAIELKYPRNGQYPEQMFKTCQDIYFLEQLHRNGFTRCFFLMVANTPLFYERGSKTGIYKYFRAGVPIHGCIEKPTGAKNGKVEISGSYSLIWEDGDKDLKYTMVKIG